MKSRWIWIALALVVAGTVLGYWQASVAMREILHQPFRVPFLSDVSLTGRLLEVSSNVDPVANAGRQVVQPWGALQLKKVFPTNEAPPPMPPTDESARKNDPHIP